MFRSILSAVALSMILLPVSVFAIDTGKPGGMAPAPRVSGSLNLARDKRESTVGFSRLDPGGRGLKPLAPGGNSRSPGGAYSAMGRVIILNGGKSNSTETNVPGRNDPPPMQGGRRPQGVIGGLGY